MLKIACILIASIAEALAVSSTGMVFNSISSEERGVGLHADYLAACNSTSRCQKQGMYCWEGVCQCPPNKAPIMLRGELRCREIVQIKRISTIEDHPWVISNASCLSSEKAVAKSSCRHSPCYSGILVDLLRSADEDGKFLDNCTITKVSSVGRFKSGAWTNNSIMDHLAGNV
ncbi:hypothetical protein Fcan01_19155 [Folsomia candida]|uniref:Uncharacterized protein n=1 Tax=Folsomia candida TaxID=158441 RepID=A0A226DPB9_FOLCA|nr:hypothetical protein Fcan01_19155 [Folsomia candida]